MNEMARAAMAQMAQQQALTPASRPARHKPSSVTSSIREQALAQMASQRVAHDGRPPMACSDSVKKALLDEYQKFLAEMEAEEAALDTATVDSAVDAFVTESEPPSPLSNGISVGDELGGTVAIKPKRSTRKKKTDSALESVATV